MQYACDEYRGCWILHGHRTGEYETSDVMFLLNYFINLMLYYDISLLTKHFPLFFPHEIFETIYHYCYFLFYISDLQNIVVRC